MLISDTGGGDHSGRLVRRPDHGDTFGRSLLSKHGGQGIINDFDIAWVDRLRHGDTRGSWNYNARIMA